MNTDNYKEAADHWMEEAGRLEKMVNSLTLNRRDQIAAQCMIGLLSSKVGSGYSFKGLAQQAVECADELIAELDTPTIMTDRF